MLKNMKYSIEYLYLNLQRTTVERIVTLISFLRSFHRLLIVPYYKLNMLISFTPMLILSFNFLLIQVDLKSMIHELCLHVLIF